MITDVQLIVRSCGITLAEAADYLNTSTDTVKSWSTGRRKAPPHAIEKLVELNMAIKSATDNNFRTYNEKIFTDANRKIPIAVQPASNDADAQAAGFPFLGAQLASLGHIIAEGRRRGFDISVKAPTT